MYLKINPHNPEPRQIDRVAQLLKQGGIIAYPTDTCYGLGCDIMNKKAIEKVYQIKQLDKKQPFSFICSEPDEYQPVCKGYQLCLQDHETSLAGPLYIYFGRIQTRTENNAHQKKNSRHQSAEPSDMPSNNSKTGKPDHLYQYHPSGPYHAQ